MPGAKEDLIKAAENKLDLAITNVANAANELDDAIRDEEDASEAVLKLLDEILKPALQEWHEATERMLNAISDPPLLTLAKACAEDG